MPHSMFKFSADASGNHSNSRSGVAISLVRDTSSGTVTKEDNSASDSRSVLPLDSTSGKKQKIYKRIKHLVLQIKLK